jgi:hypothetical protein
MTGSSGSGGTIEPGRFNFAESTTFVEGGRPSELDVNFDGLAVLEAGPRRDDQRPDATVSGVIGRGWNGPVHNEPGAGLIGVGSPNHGPGVVGLGGGHRIASTFLGSPGNLGEDGLGGTGVIGLGGDGAETADSPSSDVAADPGLFPGVGVVGKGGASLFPSLTRNVGNGAGLVGIAGGLGVAAVDGNLSQIELTATENVGVVGFGGNGPVSVGGEMMGPDSAGAGVRGIGGVAQPPGPIGTPMVGGPGVAGTVAPVPLDATLMGVGVAGISNTWFGVSGTSGSQAGVNGQSTSGPGVSGGSSAGIGVAGASTHAEGGYFASTEVAQIHLDPHRPDALADPNGFIRGRAGNLLTLIQPNERPGSPEVATLWFCRISGDKIKANWVQLA